MSAALPEGTPQASPLPVQPPDDGGTDLVRYTLHIPVADFRGKDSPHVLASVRQQLSAAGLNGRIVIRHADGDWKDGASEPMNLVMIDAPDDPTTLQVLTTIAQGVKQLMGRDSLYITKQPVRTYLV